MQRIARWAQRRPRATASRPAGRVRLSPAGVRQSSRCAASPAAPFLPGKKRTRSLWVFINAPWYNWLLRQLKSANDDRPFVGIRWPSRCHDTVCRLTELRDDPKSIVSHAARPPRSFEVFYLSQDARRFSGRKTFIEEIERLVRCFYDTVGQNLKRWVAKPPKPVSTDKVDSEARLAKENEARPTRSDAPGERSRPTPGNRHSALIDIRHFLRRAITRSSSTNR